MAERRSLGVALDMTPEKVAFIKGQQVTPSAAPAESKDVQKRRIELPITEAESESPKVEAPKAARRASRNRSNQPVPAASEILDHVLVPITIRLPHRTVQTLRRAHLEQRLNHAKPDTQQEIIEEALSDWLAKQGFVTPH